MMILRYFDFWMPDHYRSESLVSILDFSESKSIEVERQRGQIWESGVPLSQLCVVEIPSAATAADGKRAAPAKFGSREERLQWKFRR